MASSRPGFRTFDPDRHDSHLVALFGDQASAASARAALLAAGISPDAVVLMAGDGLHDGVRHPVQDLFVPEDDYHDYHHALGRGLLLLLIRPPGVDARDAAVAALEAAGPLDVAMHGRRWRGTASGADRPGINHATVSRADMRGRAVGGRDAVILDMTGQKMSVRTLSEADMAGAPFAPRATPADHPAPLAPPPPRDVPTGGTTYTHGVPLDIVRRMTAEEQVMAQRHSVAAPGEQATQGTFLRMVDGRTRIGWRDRPPAAGRVRSYVTERDADPVS